MKAVYLLLHILSILAVVLIGNVAMVEDVSAAGELLKRGFGTSPPARHHGYTGGAARDCDNKKTKYDSTGAAIKPEQSKGKKNIGCPAGDSTTPGDGGGGGKKGIVVPSTDTGGLTSKSFCGILGPNAALCDLIVGCVTGDCLITTCLRNPLPTLPSGAASDACNDLCLIDPSNRLCAAIECAQNPGRACCGIFDIPECCQVFEFKDDVMQCASNPSAQCCSILEADFGGIAGGSTRGFAEQGTRAAKVCKSLIGCANAIKAPGPLDPNLLMECCKLDPKSSGQCEMALDCGGTAYNAAALNTSPTDAGRKAIATCCKYFPYKRECEIFSCLDNPSAQCCYLFENEPVVQSLCLNILGCHRQVKNLDPKDITAVTAGDTNATAVDAGVGCCTRFPKMAGCKTIGCMANPTLECCKKPLNIATPQCLNLYKCTVYPTKSGVANPVDLSGTPLNGDPDCCKTYASSNLLSCQLLDCYSYIPGDTRLASCCKHLPNIPQCLTIANCHINPTVECCDVTIPGNEVNALLPECQKMGKCLLKPTKSCCGKYNGIPTCQILNICSGTPTTECCSQTIAQFLPSCRNKDDCDAGNLTVNCCLMSPYTPGCTELLECAVRPTQVCCAAGINRTLPACIERAKCLAKPTIKCCMTLDKGVSACAAKLVPAVVDACISGINAQCCGALQTASNAGNLPISTKIPKLCNTINKCVVSPDVTCCRALMKNHPVCTMFKSSLLRTRRGASCN